ncbi:MAG: Gldg family protein [bacterium]
MKSQHHGIASKIGTGLAGLALVAVIVIAANLILSAARLRLDLTSDRQFSLSDGTRRILDKMDREVVLKFYFSRSAEMPMNLKADARHVADLLQEYRLASHGRVILEQYDPTPDSDYEEWAQNEGLEPQTINPFSPPAYFGLVAKCGSEQQCIPSLSAIKDTSLEYTLTRLISRVIYPQKPVLGVLSSLPVMGAPMNQMMMMMQPPRNEGWVAFKMLKEDYDVRTVPPEAEQIEPEISTLIVVHPKNLSNKMLFAIDQFVLRGGRLVACVDPLSSVDGRSSENANPMMRMGNDTSSTLGKLFEAWGIGFDATKVIADLGSVTQLAGQGRVIESPTFLWLKSDRMNREDLLSAQLSQIMLPFAGSLTDNTGGKLAFTPLLFSSSDSACPVDAMGAQYASVSSIRTQFKPDNLKHVLAARLKGTFQTAFPGGPAGAGTNAAPNQLVKGNSAVLIVADTDFLCDETCVRAVSMGFGLQSLEPINDNLTFFINAVEQLSGREELLSLRARGSYRRPFKHVDELDLRAMRSLQAREEELSKKLEAARAQIQELQNQKKGTQKLLLSRAQQEAVERFRQDEKTFQRQLKEVRKELRRDMENLGIAVKTVNIAAMPLFLIIFGIVRTVARRKRV